MFFSGLQLFRTATFVFQNDVCIVSKRVYVFYSSLSISNTYPSRQHNLVEQTAPLVKHVGQTKAFRNGTAENCLCVQALQFIGGG